MQERRSSSSSSRMDDIDYLLPNADVDSTMIVVDSAKRIYSAYPTPSEYSLEFSQPFRFVHGVDIIDATIPAATYNVDTHNNALCFGISRLPAPVSALNGKEAAAALQAALDILDKLLDFHAYYQHKEHDMRVLLMRRELSPEALSNAQAVAGPDEAGFRPPPRPTRYFVVCMPSTTTTPDAKLKLVELELAQAQYESELQEGDWWVDLAFHSVNIEVGNYSIDTLLAHLRRLLRSYNMDVAAAGSVEGGILRRPVYRFSNLDNLTGMTNMFMLDMQKSTCAVQLGFDLDAAAMPHVQVAEYMPLRWGSNRRVYGSLPPPPDAALGSTSLAAPGIVNLIGTRYVTLRCPEIESHMLGSFNSETLSTGLGVFKLSAPYEMSNLKFDFFNFVKKPFHPIGKLPRLTLRFETSDGRLYDFKGMNHQMLIAIKYYVPRLAVRALPRSILNPDYDPDSLRFSIAHEQRLGDDDDDDSEYEYGDHYDNYDRQQEQQDAARARNYMAMVRGGGGVRPM